MFLGVDPGKKGAFVLMNSDRRLISYWDMPQEGKIITAHGIRGIYRHIHRLTQKPFTVIEKPHSRPTDARSAIATYHWESGQLMMAVAWGWPVQLIQPNIWTKSIHVGLAKDLKAKQKSVLAFKSLFPELAEKKDFINGKTIYDGRIDALLIAEYGRRLYYGKSD